MDRENTIVADSVCPEQDADDISKVIEEKFGQVYRLGGLGGIPFTGK